MAKSLKEKLKEHGFKVAVKFVLAHYLGTEYNKAHYLRLNIDIDKINRLLADFDLDVKELEYDDFLKGDPIVFRGRKLEKYKKRCADPTYKAYGIIENGRLIYSTWISLHKMGMVVERKQEFLAPHEGYLEDSYCAPIARGRGFHSRMNNYRIKKIYEAGKNRVIAIVQEGNIPAMKVQLKSGFEEIGHFYHGYIFGIKFNTLNKSRFDGK